MTTLNAYGSLTLLELAKRIDPKGQAAIIAEILNRDNPIIQDMPLVEANDITTHLMTRRYSLPAGSWRSINAGVATEASRTIQVREGIGMLESYSEVDKKLVDLAPNPAQFRMSEAAAFIEGMSQTMATTFFYGNAGTDPEQFSGIATRMPGLAATTNVIGHAGTGSDVTSLYIVQWGPEKVFGIYPRGSASMGVNHKDLGEVTLQDASDYNYQGYRDHFQAKIGLAVRDMRCIARLANIVVTQGAANTFDEDKLIEIMNRMPNSGGGSTIYVNSTIKTQMEIKLKDKANINYTVSQGLGGAEVLQFRGSPVKKCDAILTTEAEIS